MDPMHKFERVIKILVGVILLAAVSLLVARAVQGQMSPYDNELSHQLRGVSSPVLSPDGRMVAYVRTTSDTLTHAVHSEIVIVNVTNRKELATFSGSAPTWNAASSDVAFVDSRDGRAGIWIRAIATGVTRFISAANFTNALTTPVAPSVIWSRDGTTLWYLATTVQGMQLVSARSDGGAVTPVVQCACALSQLTIDSAVRIAAFVRSTSTEPPDVYTVSLTGGGVAKPLTRVNARVVLEALMTEVQSFDVQRADGAAIQVWVTPPAAIEAGRGYPTILSLRSQSESSNGYAFDDYAQLMSTRGYAVVRIDTGNSSSDEEEFRALMSGVDSAIAHTPWIDITKLSVTGHSQRGVTSAFVAANAPRFKLIAEAP